MRIKSYKIVIVVIVITILCSSVVLGKDIKKKVEVIFGKVNYEVGGKIKQQDTLTYNKKTYVPLTVITEMLGKDIMFDSKTSTLKINTGMSIEEYKNIVNELEWNITYLENQSILSLAESNKESENLSWPVLNHENIIENYGEFTHPILKTKQLHTGIKIEAPIGTSVFAANDGTILVAGEKPGYGKTIIIDHGNNITTLYANNSVIKVEVGQKIKKGDTISESGQSIWSTKPYLLFEVRIYGAPVNPIDYLK